MVVDHIIMTQNRCLNRPNFQKLLNHTWCGLEGGWLCMPSRDNSGQREDGEGKAWAGLPPAPDLGSIQEKKQLLFPLLCVYLAAGRDFSWSLIIL